jgi:tRNA A-37 threonylcarbamoyl transferase component Bud32
LISDTAPETETMSKVESFGNWSTSIPLDDAADLIAYITGLEVAQVHRRWERLEEPMRIREAFADCWPASPEDFAQLGAQFVLTMGMDAEIAEVTGMSRSKVARALRGTDDRTSCGQVLPELAPSPDKPGAPFQKALRTQSLETVLHGRWRVLDRVGEGGTAQVFTVVDTSGRIPGILILKKAISEAHEREIRHEHEVAHGLQHENICSYLLRGEDPSFGPYLIQQFGGMSLDQIIRNRGTVDLINAIEVLVGVSMALNCAHAKGIIHGDVKPANILVEERQQGERVVRIADFGVAARSAEGIADRGMRFELSADACVSPEYAAPETISGIISPASDQYSLAAVICSMLEGRVFEERFTPEITLRYMNAALARALQPDPAARFGTCVEFAQDLLDAWTVPGPFRPRSASSSKP